MAAAAMIAAGAILVFAVSLALLLMRGREDERAVLVVVVVLLAAGLAGYAVTGRPDVASPLPRAFVLQPGATPFETERQLRLSRFGRSAAWLTFADALLAADASAMAVRGLRGAIAAAPRDAGLWIGLGHALALHGGEVGAASRLAFDRAAALAPDSLQPAFFLGLTQYETGDRAGALQTWQRLKKRSLPDAGLDAWIGRAEGG